MDLDLDNDSDCSSEALTIYRSWRAYASMASSEVWVTESHCVCFVRKTIKLSRLSLSALRFRCMRFDAPKAKPFEKSGPFHLSTTENSRVGP